MSDDIFKRIKQKQIEAAAKPVVMGRPYAPAVKAKTEQPSRAERGRFAPGNKIGLNRGKTFAERIRACVAERGLDIDDLLVEQALRTLEGQSNIPLHDYSGEPRLDAKGEPIFLKPNVKDQAEAREWFSNRLYGKAKESVELTGKDGGPLEVDSGERAKLIRKMSPTEIKMLLDLKRKLKEPEQHTDAELVPERDQSGPIPDSDPAREQ